MRASSYPDDDDAVGWLAEAKSISLHLVTDLVGFERETSELPVSVPFACS